MSDWDHVTTARIDAALLEQCAAAGSDMGDTR